MFALAKAHLKARTQALLVRYNYQAVPFLRAAKLSANEGMLELLRATLNGSEFDKEFANFALNFGSDSFSQWQQDLLPSGQLMAGETAFLLNSGPPMALLTVIHICWKVYMAGLAFY